MTTWAITQKSSYLTDFIELSRELQKRVIEALLELEQDPITPRGNTIKPLKGWTNLWRYRLGDYRLLYAAVPEQRVVALLAVGPRGEIYRRFNYDPEQEPMTQLVFGPALAAQLTPQPQDAPAWVAHPEWFQAQSKPAGEPLPRKLTPALLERWLIAPEYHAPLMHCRTDEDLLQANLPDAVLGRVMDGLWPPTVQQLAAQPSYALFRPEDLEEYATGTLRTFLLHLDDQQKGFVDWALQGPTLLKGGPGSGKSTVALYRVRALVEHGRRRTGQAPSVLFTTYTNALTAFSESLLRQLLGDALPETIKVTTVDKIVTHLARKSGFGHKLATTVQGQEALHAALAALPTGDGDRLRAQLLAALYDLDEAYLLDEFGEVIEAQNCRTVEAYLAVKRTGRAVPFRSPLRHLIWELYTAWRARLAVHKLCTWGQLRQAALDAVRDGQITERWDYVIIDEAQDLTPTALALCVELCRTPAGVFLTADANQSIYQRGFRWQDVHEGLRVAGRTRVLRRNYRTTQEIMGAASQVLTALDEADGEVTAQDYVHRGAPPAIYAADGAGDQARWLANQLVIAAKSLRLPINAAAILVPSKTLGPSLAEQLSQFGVPARFMASADLDLTERSVKVMTLHAAKGLEFPIVAIAHVEADRLPSTSAAASELARQEHLADQRRLLYVGCTRAMRYLFLTYDRAVPSPFLHDLNEAHWLYWRD